jgi:endoglucanase Acf2
MSPAWLPIAYSSTSMVPILAAIPLQTWILYAGKAVTLTLTGTSTLTASAPFSGALRLALAPGAAAAQVLDQHSGVWPANGDVSYQVRQFTLLCFPAFPFLSAFVNG